MQARVGLDGSAGGADSGTVAGDAGQMALLGPAAVAVHDDGDVARQALEVELLEERGFHLVGWFECLCGFHRLESEWRGQKKINIGARVVQPKERSRMVGDSRSDGSVPA